MVTDEVIEPEPAVIETVEPARPLTAESAKAVADQVIEETVVPKKIPALDDIDGQTKAIVGAMSSALLTATEMPLSLFKPVVGALSAQLVAYGVRQTEYVNPEAIYAPAWVLDGMRQEAAPVPPEAQHTEAEPVVQMTAEAPEIPAKIPKAAKAVKL